MEGTCARSQRSLKTNSKGELYIVSNKEEANM